MNYFFIINKYSIIDLNENLNDYLMELPMIMMIQLKILKLPLDTNNILAGGNAV